MDFEPRIIRNAQVLTEGFIPGRMVHRDGQLKAIRDNLRPVLKGFPARHMFLHGKPGTGKTCMSNYVSQELKEHTSNVTHSYINCWENPSKFKVLYSIIQSLGLILAVHRKGTPTDELIDVLRKKLEGKHAIIVLDEVDQLDDDKVLYDLLSIPMVCLVLISNDMTAMAGMDQRIRSRLASADSIEFPPYSAQEIAEILKDRVEWGIIPGAVKNRQLESIAGLSGGDARIALNVLRTAAEAAENKDLEKIPDELIKSGLPKAKESILTQNMDRMNPYQRIVMEILKSGGTTDSGTLLRELQALSEKRGLDPIVDRTFRKYMSKMIKYRMVASKGSGRWRTYSLAN
jgi:orc1/cdc6 family replication initiation protein